MKLNGSLDTTFISQHDSKTHRVCGTCGELKPVSEFYKDGKDNYGNVRYRRDCKDCYKRQRIIDARRQK